MPSVSSACNLSKTVGLNTLCSYGLAKLRPAVTTNPCSSWRSAWPAASSEEKPSDASSLAVWQTLPRACPSRESPLSSEAHHVNCGMSHSLKTSAASRNSLYSSAAQGRPSCSGWLSSGERDAASVGGSERSHGSRRQPVVSDAMEPPAAPPARAQADALTSEDSRSTRPVAAARAEDLRGPHGCLTPWIRLSPPLLAGHKHSESVLQQFYNRLPVRKRFLKAIRKGTLIWDKGQVKIPPIAMQGYGLPNKLVLPHQQEFNNKLPKFKGKINHLKAPRIWFQD